jgi:glycosyltransferase involved in cell wall biosynthesis
LTVCYYRKQGGGSFVYARQLGQACRTFAPQADLVHAHILWSYPLQVAARAARAAHVPYVLSLRGMLLPEALAISALNKRIALRLGLSTLLAQAAALHCTSEEERAALAPFGWEVRAFIVPNPVDTEPFGHMPPRGALRARLGLAPDAPLVLFAGRLHAIKGLDLALQAFAQAGRPDAQWVLIGPDEQGLWPALQRQAKWRARGVPAGHAEGPDRMASRIRCC